MFGLILEVFQCTNTIHIQANVVYPDYGNTEWATVSELRYLPPQFYELPFQVRASTPT